MKRGPQPPEHPGAAPPRRRTATLSLALLAPWLLLAASAFGGETPPTEAPAWFEKFRIRRRIVLDQGATRGDAVLLRIGTARLTRPDARDIRVVLDHRQAVPLDIVEVGPGDTALLRFAIYDPEREHHLYLGSPSAPRPRRPRRLPREGLLLELLPLGGGSCDTWRDTQKLLRAATTPLGLLTPRSISLGIPPLGRTRDYIARYTGQLRIEEEGEYTFETVSEGGSFVLVNERLVASWPGFHGLGGYADPEERESHSGSVRLKAGVHWVEYVVVTRRGGVHLLGWSRPGEDRTHPLRSRDFVRWLPARVEDIESPGGPLADFDWRSISDTGSDVERHDLAELAFRFSGDLGGRKARGVRWSFGDGQTAEGLEVRHVYLHHGTYEVTAAVEVSADLTLEAKRTVVARFESLERTDLNALLDGYHRATEGYDLASLPGDHLEQLVWLRSKDDRWEKALHSAIDSWYLRGLSRDEAAPERIERLGMERALKLFRKGERTALTRRILETLAEGSGKVDRREEAKVWLAWLDSERGQGAGARGDLEELYRTARSRDAKRRAGVFTAELLLREGKEEEARAILEALEEDEEFRKATGSRRLSSGARSLSFDSLLREKRYPEAGEELDRWEWELPADRLSGALQIQRARLLLVEGRAADALRELESVWKLSAADREMPRALLLAASALEKKGDLDAARERLKAVLRDFPHRPESREAAERIEALR